MGWRDGGFRVVAGLRRLYGGREVYRVGGEEQT